MKATLSSRFTSVLDTNYAPSSEERDEIESVLYDPEERLRILDTEISKLQAEREELRQYIGRHRALLSPFRRLPADLWGEIFVQALPSNEYNLPGRTLKDAPLLLTTICRTWREIAIKTPRLWNNIHIYLPRRFFRPHMAQLPSLLHARKEGVKAWLDRSGSLPMAFSIAFGPDARARATDSGPSHSEERQEIDAILASFSALLTQYSRRWRAIRISLENNDVSPIVWQSFAELTLDDLPLLQDVRVNGALFTRNHNSQTTSITPTPISQLLRKLPVLRRLNVSGENSDNVLGLSLRWDTVTDLHISSYNDTDPPAFVARLVESCPNLSSLSLILVPGHHHQQQPAYRELTTSLEWKFLRTLEMKFMEGYWHDVGDPLSEPLRETFRRLRTPALEHLVLNAFRYNASPQSRYAGHTMPFQDMIMRSHSPVTHLALDRFFFTNTDALFRTLESLPSLKSLKFSKGVSDWTDVADEDTDADDVHALNATLLSLCPPANICPALEKLELPGCNLGHIDAIITLATTAPSLKDLSLEFGVMRKESVTKSMLSKRVREALVYLREVKGTRVVWKWPKDCIDNASFDSPYAGMKSPRFQSTYEFL